MAIINPWPAQYQDNYCTCRRHLLITDLCSLSDRELQEIGIWRDAIPQIAEELVSRDGCNPHNDV